MGLSPGPALLFAIQINLEGIFVVVVAEGWFRAQGLCTTEAESRSLVFAEQPDVPGETTAPKY